MTQTKLSPQGTPMPSNWDFEFRGYCVRTARSALALLARESRLVTTRESFTLPTAKLLARLHSAHTLGPEATLADEGRLREAVLEALRKVPCEPEEGR